MIKFLDIYKQDKNLHKSIIKDINKLFKKGDFILGKEVINFENNFAKYIGKKYGISFSVLISSFLFNNRSETHLVNSR